MEGWKNDFFYRCVLKDRGCSIWLDSNKTLCENMVKDSDVIKFIIPAGCTG